MTILATKIKQDSFEYLGTEGKIITRAYKTVKSFKRYGLKPFAGFYVRIETYNNIYQRPTSEEIYFVY
jgi:hypothetical protein